MAAGSGTRVASAGSSARTKLLVSLLVGVVAAAAAVVLGAGRAAPLVGWDVLAVTFCAWMWRSIWPLDAGATASHAQRENPGRELTDAVLVIAAAASLAAVGVVLFGASQEQGNGRYLEAGLALVSVFISWTLIHTVFTTKYARLYYGDEVGGIDFNEKDPPDYGDFAYLAFTIGMTFQVSDTDLQTKAIRREVLRQALLSFLFGTVIIAVTINAVAGFIK